MTRHFVTFVHQDDAQLNERYDSCELVGRLDVCHWLLIRCHDDDIPAKYPINQSTLWSARFLNRIWNQRRLRCRKDIQKNQMLDFRGDRRFERVKAKNLFK